MLDRAGVYLISVPQLALDADQILGVQARGKGLSATATIRRLVSQPCIFIEADTQLRRALKDVKEFSEWQPKQCENHR